MLKKYIFILASIVTLPFFARAQGNTENPSDFLLMTTLAPFILPLATTTSGDHHGVEIDKQLMVAAQNDAVAFIDADGRAPKSALLRAAIRQLDQIPEIAQLKEVEKAQAVLVFANN